MERRLNPRDDRGALKVATIGKVVVTLGVLGAFGYDGFACMSNNVSTESDAQNAAYAASQAWHNDHESLPLAYQAAVQFVAGKNETVLTQGFSVDQDGTIHLVLQRTAKTVVFKRIGPLKHLTVTEQHGDANSVN